MADHVVGGDAQGVGIAAVVEAGGQGPVVEGEFPRQLVEKRGRHARLHMRRERIQAFRRQPSGRPHALEAFGSVDLDPAGADLALEDVFDQGHLRL